jgi:hypothetical protein
MGHLVHGMQEGRHFNAYYDGYCYLPLYAFVGSVPLLAVIFHEPVTPLSTRPVEGVKWGLDGGFFKIAVAPRPLGGFRTSNPSFLGHF